VRSMSRKHPAWDAWYDLAVWVKRARYQLRVEPLCRMCASEGRITIAVVCDHVEPHHGDWNKFRLGAVQSLCRHCHDSPKRLIERRGYDPAIGKDGYPLDRRHPVYKASR